MSKKSITVLLAMGMAFSVLADAHNKVQLWKDGPYWAETNIGAEKPWEYGYYFWWGDTVGYKRVNDAWVVSDGSNANFSFISSNTPTWGKEDIAVLQREGWITENNVLAPEHDAAHVLWGGEWRMPTDEEQNDLCNKCDWTWTTTNGVNGYVVHGRGTYASNWIFIPCAGIGVKSLFDHAGLFGYYWSSTLTASHWSDHSDGTLSFGSDRHYTGYSLHSYGQSVRPVQGVAK